ncbi:MAG: hypothetical protein QM786_00615 [Breznakibacter sp.]
MEKEFDLPVYGKANPYKIPDGFFDKLPEETLSMAKKRDASHKRTLLATAASLAVAASLALAIFWPSITTTSLPNDDPMAFNNDPALNETMADSVHKQVFVSLSDTLKMGQVTDTSTKSAPSKSLQANMPPAKKEDLDDLLAELSFEELMMIADNGDDDHFIND